MNDPTQVKEWKKQLRELKKEMKENGIRVISCFNGGLTPSESRYNSELFRLKTLIGPNK